MNRKQLIRAIITCTVVLVICLAFAIGLTLQRGRTEPTLRTDPPATSGTTAQTAPSATQTAPTQTGGSSIPTEPETEPEPTGERFVLTFAGDCTFGFMPEWEGRWGSFDTRIGDNFDLPFQYVREYFENDDCTFVNLEGVLADDGTPEDKMFTFRGPVKYVNILTGSSVEAVSLANNHTYDFGKDGYLSTKNVLDENGVDYVERNSSLLLTTKSGLTIGVYGVLYTLNAKDMRSEVAQLRADGAELIIAAVHWGEEYKYRPNDNQIVMAHTLIDAGVDIVWGHHPHVLQRIEEYNGGIIYYSLGNFSFGGNRNPPDKDTAVLRQEIIRDTDGTVRLGELTIIPCSVSSVSKYNDFQPTPLEVGSEAYQRILTKLDGTFTGPDLEVNREEQKPTETTTPTEPPTETTEPETTAPETTEPEVTEPEITEPEVTEPEITEPEVTEPEPTEPEVTEPETTEPAPEESTAPEETGAA